MSELKQSVIRSILDFSFDNYGGFDLVEETKDDTATNEWVYDLANKIEEDWVKHVDGI